MNLNELCTDINTYAKEKGWWQQKRSALEIHMLIVSEIAEATESVRDNEPSFFFKGEKPEGESVELVDALIRILDYFGERRWDLDKVIKAKMDYNKTREFRHGGKAY